nr:putative DNA-binding protein [Anoxybacter fermentans]
MEKKIRMGELYDFYGQLLTSRQQEFMELYYQHDLSLGEIAEKFAVSRQAVYDNLRRSEELLKEYEAKLKLLAKNKELRKKIKLVKELVEGLDCDPEKRQEIITLIDQLLDG